MAGERRTYFYVEFAEKKDHQLPNGRKIKIDAPKVYIKKDRDWLKPHQASHLTESLAQQIAERYPLRNPKVQTDTEYDFDLPALLNELHEVGEVEAPVIPVNKAAKVFEQAIYKALEQLSRKEVFDVFGKAFVE